MQCSLYDCEFDFHQTNRKVAFIRSVEILFLRWLKGDDVKKKRNLANVKTKYHMMKRYKNVVKHEALAGIFHLPSSVGCTIFVLVCIKFLYDVAFVNSRFNFVLLVQFSSHCAFYSMFFSWCFFFHSIGNFIWKPGVCCVFSFRLTCTLHLPTQM